jgi:hypothetical protein
MENATTAATKDNENLLKAARITRTLLRAGTGVLALNVGVTMLTLGSPLLLVLGGLAAYTGARHLFETAREVLPLKVQSFFSSVLFGKPLTEITPVRQPSTPIGKAFRALEYVALGVTGAAAYFAGSLALALAFGGSTQGAANLALSGFGAAVTGIAATGLNIVRSVRGLVQKHAKASVAPDASQAASPEAAPAPALAAKATAPSFNQAATPDAAPQNPPAPEARPVPPAPKM